MSITARLNGTRGLRRIMRRYPKRVKAQATFELRAAALEVRDDARRFAPVDTDNLVSSIQTDFQELDKLYAQVFSVLEYARRQEYGFTGTDSLGRKYDQAGSFYFTKAAKKAKKDFSKRMANAVRRAAP
jgi:CMP-N-acetylneuraminic acid synthetase